MIKLIQFGAEGLMIALLCVAAYSQVIRPLLRKTPAFPIFRRKPRLEAAIEAVNEDLDVKDEQRVLAEKKRQLGE